GTGGTNAPAWSDSVYLSLDATLDPSDLLLGRTADASALDVGESYSNSLTVTLPEGLDGGYYLLVQADSGDQVVEPGHEDNNTGSTATSVRLSPAPDLRATAVDIPDQAFSGQVLNVSFTVTNIGDAPTRATGWDDAVVLSHDGLRDNSDRNLNAVQHVG